ncbi:hypothetical protein ACHAWC_002130, partial [Mediolabrus comicus]
SSTTDQRHKLLSVPRKGFEQPILSHTKNMQIIINTPESSTAYSVEGTTTVTDLKSMIENREFIPSHLVRLVSGDAELLEGTLAGNGVEEDEELELCLEIPGGMRAKWRKKRMRRLRRKRRKMRQRAR